MEHVPGLPLEESVATPLLILTVVAVAVGAVGLVSFRKRDLVATCLPGSRYCGPGYHLVSHRFRRRSRRRDTGAVVIAPRRGAFSGDGEVSPPDPGQVLNQAMADGLLLSNPVEGVKAPKYVHVVRCS